MSDRTLLIVKPDAVAAGFADAIEKLIFANDFAVLAKLETTLSPAQVEEFYEELEGTASYLGVVTLMSSGPIVALALEKTGGINALLELLGPENALLAKEMAPTSIRAVYGSGPIKNAAHGSDTPVAAFRELKFFFPKLFPREVTTLVVLPDAKDKAKDIIAAAAAEGFLCIAKKSLELTPEQAAAFYDGTADEETVAHLSSGAIEVVALEMPFAVESMLAMAGPADPADAKEEAPMSIRARYGTDAVKKAIHVSGTISAAAREAAFFFGSSLSSGETTFAWVKPDAFPKADVVIAIAEASGFTVLASEQVSLSKEAAADFASSPDEVAVMTSGPALALVLMRPCAVQAWLSLLGPADSGAAKSSEPLSLRAQFGTDAVSNACHGSASAAAAEKEAKLFFPHLFQPEQTLALIAPDAVPFSDELIAAAASAGLVVSESCVTTLDAARAADFLDLLGMDKPTPAAPPVAPDLFFSAWVEGSKCNKVLQLFNPTGEEISLETYAMPFRVNKGTVEGRPDKLLPFPPMKCVPPGGVFVLYHPQAKPEIKSMLPVDPRHSAAWETFSNGNDGFALVKVPLGMTTLVEGADQPYELLDYIGDFTGANGGTPWPVAGVVSATKDKTLVRKASVAHGNATAWTDPTASSQGVSAATSEWTVCKKDTFSSAELGWSVGAWRFTPPAPAPPPAGSYEATLALLSSGPSVVLALSGKGAVATWNALLGPVDPLLAKVRCPGCLRARFGTDATSVVSYASTSAAAAFKQLKLFFPKTLIDPLPSSKQAGDYVKEVLSPTLTAGLVELCRVKPINPVEWLAEWLLANNPNSPHIN